MQSGASKFLLAWKTIFGYKYNAWICRSRFWVFPSVPYHFLVEMVTMYRIITDCIWHFAWVYNNMCFWLTTSREEFLQVDHLALIRIWLLHKKSTLQFLKLLVTSTYSWCEFCTADLFRNQRLLWEYKEFFGNTKVTTFSSVWLEKCSEMCYDTFWRKVYVTEYYWKIFFAL